MTPPTAADLRFLDCCRKLFAGAADGRWYGPAWAAVAEAFGALSVQLIPDVRVPGTDIAPAAVQVFDRTVDNDALARALAATGADHGLCACIRPAARGVDVVVVLRKGRPFTEAERTWMEMLATPIRSALDLGDRLASSLPTADSAALLARLLPMPCALTDEAGWCIDRNEAFEKILQDLSGSTRSGRVEFADPFLQDSWQHALVEGRATDVTQSLLATSAGGRRWKVHVVPFACVNSPADRTPRHLMLAMFETAAAPPIQTAAVPSYRPLTKAELEVLSSLLLGHTAKVIARTRGASVNTVRSQITSILGKTGHHTQKELIASFSGASSFGALEARGDAPLWQ